MTNPSPRQQHLNNQRKVLLALARYGYLRASDIALLVYFDKASAGRLAQRLLAKMCAEGQVLRRAGRAGEEHHYALSEPGATEVTRLTGTHQGSGKDLLRSISGHRDGANRICILAQAAGYDVLTDREICREPERAFLDKVPDALIIEDELDSWGGERKGYVWVEVEHAYRSTTDLKRLADFILRVFAEDDCCVAYRGGWLDEVHLVISDPVAAGIGHRLRRKLAERVGEAKTRRLFARGIRVLSL